MSNDAWREVVAERKARTVKDTGFALWPDRTLVREWPNVPTSIRDECRDNLLTYSSEKNTSAQKWVTDPLSDNVEFPGDWRCVSVSVEDVPGRGFSVRQTLGLGMYRSALPDPFLVSSEDKSGTPFDEVTITESQRLIEYRNIHPDYSEALKPALGTYTNFWGNTAQIIQVEIKKNEDGAHSIFVLEGDVSGSGDYPVTSGGGRLGSVQWPECPAAQQRRIFKDIPVANVAAAIATLSVSPTGYIVSAVLRQEGDRDGYEDVIQVLELKNTFDISTGFLTTQDDPLTDVEKRIVVWSNLSKGDEDNIRDTLEGTPAFSGYAVMKVDFNYRGECKVDALQYLEKCYTSATRDQSKDLISVDSPETMPVETYVYRNIIEADVDTVMADLRGEAKTYAVQKQYRGAISDIQHTKGGDYVAYQVVKVQARVVQLKAVTTNLTFDVVTNIKTYEQLQKVTYTISYDFYESQERANNEALAFSPGNSFESCTPERMKDGTWMVETSRVSFTEISRKLISNEDFDVVQSVEE